MSAYLDFYIRTKDGKYIDFTSYSRNNHIYRAFETVIPFGKITKFVNVKTDVKNNIIEEIDFYHPYRRENL